MEVTAELISKTINSVGSRPAGRVSRSENRAGVLVSEVAVARSSTALHWAF